MCVFYLHVCLHHLHAWCPWRLEGVRFCGIGVTDGCELPCGCLESNPNTQFVFLFFVLNFTFYLGISSACMSVHHMHVVLTKATRGH